LYLKDIYQKLIKQIQLDQKVNLLNHMLNLLMQSFQHNSNLLLHQDLNMQLVKQNKCLWAISNMIHNNFYYLCWILFIKI
jgi:ABC-type polysaccharide/polyol phosphate export permease